MNKTPKKYELTCFFNELRGIYRIKALRTFGQINVGDLGGFVESEDNLSHEGNCWIANDAMATGNSRVSGDAQIRDGAWVTDNAEISGNAIIGGFTQIGGNTKIAGTAHIISDRPDPGPPAVR